MPLFRSTPCLTPLGGCALLASGVILVRPSARVRFCVSSLSVFPCLFGCHCSARIVSPFSVCLAFALGPSVVCLWFCGRLPPPLGCFRVAPWPSKFLVLLVPPSGYLVAYCDGLVALPYCLECCSALLPRFILSHGSKGLWPCVG